MFADETLGFGAGASTEVPHAEVSLDLEGEDAFQFDEPTGGGNFPPRITPGKV